MSKHFTILIVCLTFMLSGCKKDTQKEPDEQEVPVKLLSKVTEISNGVTSISEDDSEGYPTTLSVTYVHSAVGAVGESKSTFEYKK